MAGLSVAETRNHAGTKWVIAFDLVWLLVVIVGFLALVNYENRPRRPAVVRSAWPIGSAIEPAPALPTVVLFAHPRCPCTRATLGELQTILEKHPNRARTWVVFYQPEGAGADWNDTDQIRSVAQWAGVERVFDVGGHEAARFGAQTSGQVFCYDPQGQLLFSGGITSARGHAGESAGGTALAAILRGRPSEVDRAPVFGCPIAEPETTSEEL